MATVGFIVDEMFEDSEFRVPYEAMKQAGHRAVIIGLEAGKELKGKRGKETIRVEKAVEEVDDAELDALVIPGGYSPDHLRASEAMVDLTRDIVQSGKPVAAICHAGWMLAEAAVIAGKTVTSWPSIKTDLMNAGAHWVDREVAIDGNIITSRKPADLPAFVDALNDQLTRRGKSAAKQRTRGEARH